MALIGHLCFLSINALTFVSFFQGEYELLEGSATASKRLWKLTNTFDDENESITTASSSPSFEVQNIADLAVEKHFEKSLATFHAKQAAAAAAEAGANIITDDDEGEEASKSSLDLSLSRTQPPFSPSSSSNSSSVLLSPRDDPTSGPSFNPKKKWLAQYGDDEVAKTDIDEEQKNSSWRSETGGTWNIKGVTSPVNIEGRSKSCPLLLSNVPSANLSLKSSLHSKHKCDLNSNVSLMISSFYHVITYININFLKNQ